MSYLIRYTETAAHDLYETIGYIDHTLLDPGAADSLLDRLDEELRHLKDFPQAHALVDDPFLKAQGIRFVVVKNYLAFYIIDENSHTVRIIRFLYGKRDWITLLKKGCSSL